MAERFFPIFRFFIETTALCHIRLVTQNGFYSPGFCCFVKFYSAKHVSMVCQGKGEHFELDCLIHEIADFASAVKKTVFAVDVKVYKIIVTHKMSKLRFFVVSLLRMTTFVILSESEES